MCKEIIDQTTIDFHRFTSLYDPIPSNQNDSPKLQFYL